MAGQAAEQDDPATAARLVKARAEVALVTAMALLGAGYALALWQAERTVLDAKFVAIGTGAAMFLLPAFVLKSVLPARRIAGILVAVAATGLGALVATASPLIALICAALGAAAGFAFYAIKDNPNYRPRLLGETS